MRRLRLLRYELFYKLLVRRDVELVSLGNASGGCRWTICPQGLSAESVVYSAGVGGDISFEHELARRFHCSVMLCDPSPTGARTMELPENQISQFRFYRIALTGQSGTMYLAAPLKQEGDWWAAPGSSNGTIEVPCADLLTWMKQNGHDHIDLLKLDIEASEYAVIDSLLEQRIAVRQLCVEFHHGIVPGIRRTQTIRVIVKLILHGYRLINHEVNNHTFIRT